MSFFPCSYLYKKGNMRRGLTRVDDILKGLVERLEKTGLEKGNETRNAWAKAAGEEAVVHTQPLSFKKGVLMVIVENSVWLYKLTVEKKGIIKRFNEEYQGRQKLVELRFRVGEIEHR